MPPTRRAKPDNRPWWVKRRYFVIPAILKPKMQDAPEGVQVILCSIVSKIVTATKKNPEHYANIASAEFKNTIGSDYHGYLEILRDWRIVDINNRYSNAEGKVFSKSYRLYPSANAADKAIVSFDKKAVQPLRDESELTNDVAKLVHRNLKRIAVRENLLPQANLIDEVEAINSAVKVYWGKFNVHYAPHAKRLYHRIVQEKWDKQKKEWAEMQKSLPPTQKEQRALKKKERQAEQERAKLNKDDILAACIQHGKCKVTIDDLKNAFPKMISQIDGNVYRTQIDNKQFHEWLAVNGLTFMLPDFVFRSQKID